MKFAIKGLAKKARERFLEEHNGEDWSPFTELFSHPSITLSMENPIDDSKPGTPCMRQGSARVCE
jgi:hypothetical protein